MIRIVQTLVMFALAVCPLLDVYGQQPSAQGAPAENSAPSIVIMQPGVERLLEDVQYLTTLAGAEGVKLWPEIRELIADVFLLGADPKLPLRVDVLLTSEETRYIFSAPVDPAQKFDESHPAWINIVAFGLQPRALGSGLYQTRNAFEGFMRYADNYVSIASEKADIPANLPPRQNALQTLLERGYDLGAEIKNPVEGQDLRRDGMQTVRENLLAALTKQPDETETAFETRKLALSQQIDELERFFVEAQHVIAGWTTDVQQKQGRMNIELTPIEGTPLAASVELLGQKPSRFAGIPQSEGSILSGRINHPLDEMRQKNYQAMFAQLRTLAEQEIDADTKLSAEQKTAAKQLSAKWFDTLSAGAQTGILDGFVESWQTAEGQRTFLLGGVVPDSQAIVAMLELIPQARPGSAVELNAEQHAAHAIHRLTVSEETGAELKDFFGAVPEVFVATGEGTIFVAAGSGANAALKQAIDQSQSQGTAALKQSVFVKLFAKVGPWVEFLDKRRGEQGDVELRRDAIQQFQQGNDLLNFEMERVDNTAVVRFNVEEGILRFVGSVITDVYKENLR